MARRRKSNPEAEDLTGDVDELVAGSAAAVDLAYEERDSLKRDVQTLEQIKERLSNEDPPRRLPREARGRLQSDKSRLKQLESLIARYTDATIRRMNKRLDRLEASPMSALRRDEIRSIRREVFKIELLARRKDIDLRKQLAGVMGGIVTLEKDITIYAPEPKRTSSRAERAKDETARLLAAAQKRWDQIRKHAAKHQVFFIRGAEVYHKDYGAGKVLENDGRRLLVAFEDREKKLTRDSVTPADVAWVDRQFSALKVKVKRGQEITKSDIQRIIRRMKDIHNRTKQQGALRTYAESKRALTSLVGRIQTKLTGDKMDKDTVESLLFELEDFQSRIPAAARSEWSRADQRQWASDTNAVRKSLVKLRRKANPCVGFHFHDKDADELLKAIEKSNERQLKSAPKKNPGKKNVAKKKVSWSASDIKGMQEFHDRKTGVKKKVSRKNPSRKKTPEWQLLCNRCAKLWDHYCERPSKARLKPVLAHLEKMKGSTSKRVADERKACLRVANKEARRLKMK
jgi:hypothetical protein